MFMYAATISSCIVDFETVVLRVVRIVLVLLYCYYIKPSRCSNINNLAVTNESSSDYDLSFIINHTPFRYHMIGNHYT